MLKSFQPDSDLKIPPLRSDRKPHRVKSSCPAVTSKSFHRDSDKFVKTVPDRADPAVTMVTERACM